MQYGNLPDEEDIKSDADMQIAKSKPWFDDFITSIDAHEIDEESEQDKKAEDSSEKVVYSKTKIRTDGYKIDYDKKEN